MDALILFGGVVLIGAFITFLITLCVYTSMFQYRYPPDFVQTSTTLGTSAVSGGTQVSSSSSTTRRNIELGTKEFWRIFNRAFKKGKPLRSLMKHRRPEDRIDFAELEKNGFSGYEYLIDGSMVDADIVQSHIEGVNSQERV